MNTDAFPPATMPQPVDPRLERFWPMFRKRVVDHGGDPRWPEAWAAFRKQVIDADNASLDPEIQRIRADLRARAGVPDGGVVGGIPIRDAVPVGRVSRGRSPDVEESRPTRPGPLGAAMGFVGFGSVILFVAAIALTWGFGWNILLAKAVGTWFLPWFDIGPWSWMQATVAAIVWTIIGIGVSSMRGETRSGCLDVIAVVAGPPILMLVLWIAHAIIGMPAVAA